MSSADREGSKSIGWLKYGAVAATVSGLSLHLMGHVTHVNVLSKLGVAADLFPKTTDWLAINGYYTAAERFFLMTEAFHAHILLIICLAVAIGIYAFGVERLGRYLHDRERLPRFMRRLPACVNDLLRNVLVPLIFFIAIPIVTAFLFVLVLMPAVLGETAANHIVAKNLQRFSQGCPHAESCTQIMRDGKILASGYVIDASETHIAIYDVALGRAKTLEIAGIEIVGAKPNSPSDTSKR